MNVTNVTNVKNVKNVKNDTNVMNVKNVTNAFFRDSDPLALRDDGLRRRSPGRLWNVCRVWR